MKDQSGHRKRQSGFVRPLLGLVLALTVGIWAALHIVTDLSFRKAIPAEVPIGPMLWHGGRISPISGCGVASFWMSPGDSSRMAREGIGALRLGLHGRGYPPLEPDKVYRSPQGGKIARGHVYHLYGPWRPTPIPPSWTEGTWLQMECSGSRRTREFTRAAKSDGAFYASSRSGWILVVPRLNRVLYSYSD